MEVRTITQAKVFILRLNLMFNQMQSSSAVIASKEKQAIVDFYHSQKVERYLDNDGEKNWSKVFKKGSKLENFNPIEFVGSSDSINFEINDYGHGIHEEWIDINEVDAILTNSRLLIV